MRIAYWCPWLTVVLFLSQNAAVIPSAASIVPAERGSVELTDQDTTTSPYEVMAEFAGPLGRQPGPLLRTRAGNLYGTTFSGGLKDYGILFRITPSGEVTVL